MIMKTLASIAFLAAVSLPTLAWADGGTISGTVTAKPAKVLPETVVYLKKVPGKPAKRTVEIDQKGMEFVPHIVTIAIGDTVKFENHDKVQHTVLSPEGGYDLGSWGAGESRSQKFSKAGVFSQVCKIHPEMLGYVFVGQNDFAVVVADDGSFSLTGVPAGTYELDVWNSKLKASGQKVTVTDGGTTSASFELKR
jgi:plastocyanin